MSSYADDTKIVVGRSGSYPVPHLQQDLQRIFDWVNLNNMRLNGAKFKHITYGKPMQEGLFYTEDKGNNIEKALSIKDLGVTLENSGSVSIHLQEKVTKAFQMVGWTLRTFRARDSNTVLTLYKSLIMPHLEYCSIIWAPTTSRDMSKLEQVQRCVTKSISGLQSMTYWERLKHLRLFSIQRRFERYLILYCFKCIHDLIPNPGIQFSLNPRTGIVCKIPVKRPSDTRIVKNMKNISFLYRSPSLFNSLPTELKQKFTCQNPLEAFKSKLDNFLFAIPDQPTISGHQRAANSNSILDQIIYMSNSS